MDKKQALKVAAHDIFSKTGYKATGISEIAKQAGVAVGSFYNYYDSKEAIFLDVYVDENNRVRQAMINEIDWGMDMVELVSQIFRTSRSYISSNKILSEWYNPMISNELHRYYSSEEGKISNSFHQFLEETFTNRIEDEGYSQERIQEIFTSSCLCRAKNPYRLQFPYQGQGMRLSGTLSIYSALPHFKGQPLEKSGRCT